jgi:hypothetical protein
VRICLFLITLLGTAKDVVQRNVRDHDKVMIGMRVVLAYSMVLTLKDALRR